jgi:hypothetical protein
MPYEPHDVARNFRFTAVLIRINTQGVFNYRLDVFVVSAGDLRLEDNFDLIDRRLDCDRVANNWLPC